MGKLILILISAAAGFMAAVAATPDDPEQRAFDRGYAAGTRAFQTEAVQAGYAAWEPGDEPQAEPTFRWTSRQPRWRSGRDWSEVHSRQFPARESTTDSFRPHERSRRSYDREEPDVG